MMDHWERAFYFGLLCFLEAYALYRYLNNQVLGRALRNGIGALVTYDFMYRIVATDGVEGVLDVERALQFGFGVSPAYAVYLNNLLGLALLVGFGAIEAYALIQINVVVLPEDEDEDEDEEDTTSRALLTAMGFDPDDLNMECESGWIPLTYFSYKGNVTMVQYLIAHGADGQKTDENGRFPMLCAAMMGHLEIMKLLSNDGGAHEDIRRVTLGSGSGISPLRMAFYNGDLPVVQWLIWNGALASRDGDGGIDDEIMRRVKWDLDAWQTVLSWAQNVVTAHDNSELFVSGTIIFPDDILEIMSDYVAGTQQEVRTLRQLIERLPAFLSAVPVVEEEEEDEE